MKNTVFTGAATAIITPLNERGVDYEKFGALIEWQIKEGIDAIVAVGTTGEGSTLTDAEHKEAIRFCVEKVAGRVPVIAGTGSYEEHLKEKVKELGREDDIIFTGFIKDVDALMNITYIQCNASYGTEATSLALLEGMSLGIPAVVSDFGGNPGVISDGDNGFLVRKKNSEALADGIRKLLADEKLYEQMSERAVEIFSHKFTAVAMTRQTEAYYDKIIENK